MNRCALLALLAVVLACESPTAPLRSTAPPLPRVSQSLDGTELTGPQTVCWYPPTDNHYGVFVYCFTRDPSHGEWSMIGYSRQGDAVVWWSSSGQGPGDGKPAQPAPSDGETSDVG